MGNFDITQFVTAAMVGSFVRWMMGLIAGSEFFTHLQVDPTSWQTIVSGAVALALLIWSWMQKRFAAHAIATAASTGAVPSGFAPKP